jgi:hypothetical protein
MAIDMTKLKTIRTVTLMGTMRKELKHITWMTLHIKSASFQGTFNKSV